MKHKSEVEGLRRGVGVIVGAGGGNLEEDERL